MDHELLDLKAYIRDVPDFPKAGILFRDITPLLGNGPAFRACITQMCERVSPYKPQIISGIESRGFIFGATMAALAVSRGAGREGIDRRMAVLLDAPLEDLGFRLRQLVTLAASSDIGVNWRTLLGDLLWWDHPARRVQRRWARSYFGGGPSRPPQEAPSTATIEPGE